METAFRAWAQVKITDPKHKQTGTGGVCTSTAETDDKGVERVEVKLDTTGEVETLKTTQLQVLA